MVDGSTGERKIFFKSSFDRLEIRRVIGIIKLTCRFSLSYLHSTHQLHSASRRGENMRGKQQALLAIACFACSLIGASQAKAGTWFWHGPRYYVAPPVTYYAPLVPAVAPVVVYSPPVVYTPPVTVYRPAFVVPPAVTYAPVSPYYTKSRVRYRPWGYKYEYKVYSPYKLGSIYKYEYENKHGRIEIEEDWD